MTLICLILLLCMITLWFFTNEYPALFGIYLPACVMRRRWFKVLVETVLGVSVLLSVASDTGNSVRISAGALTIGLKPLFLIILSSLITLLLMRLLSMRGSVVLALFGAMAAFGIYARQETDVSLQCLLSFVAAPVMAFVISALLRLICRYTVCRSGIHLITLSHYMRYVVIAGIAVTACALGLNWGGFMNECVRMVSGTDPMPVVVALITAVMFVFLSPWMSEGSDELAGIYSDYSIYAVLSSGFSVALTLLFFSFDASAGMFGLQAVPLPVAMLMASAIAGAGLAQGSALMEPDEYAREVLAFLTAPLGSLIVAYVLMHLSGIQGADGEAMEFVVISAAIFVLVALAFAWYVRNQRRQKDATQRLVYSQQQQIYENSRALHEMELKVIVSENQALHDTLELKRQEVMNVALSIVEQKEYLESLSGLADELSAASSDEERDELLRRLKTSLRQRLSYDRDVDSSYFYARAESLHEDFNAKLAENFPDLTPQERRLATLLRLGFSSKYIATLMNITPKSVEIGRYRLRQKLGLSKGDNLVNYIKSI